MRRIDHRGNQIGIGLDRSDFPAQGHRNIPWGNTLELVDVRGAVTGIAGQLHKRGLTRFRIPFREAEANWKLLAATTCH